MNRIHVKDIVIGQTYYAVCIGSISTIRFTAIYIPKASIYNIAREWIWDCYLSDIGIEYENESYVNNLNRVFETEEEARNWINTERYQQELSDHWDSVNAYNLNKWRWRNEL